MFNIREKKCPGCGAVVYLIIGEQTEKHISFDLRCCGIGCNYREKIYRLFTERKKDNE